MMVRAFIVSIATASMLSTVSHGTHSDEEKGSKVVKTVLFWSLATYVKKENEDYNIRIVCNWLIGGFQVTHYKREERGNSVKKNGDKPSIMIGQ